MKIKKKNEIVIYTLGGQEYQIDLTLNRNIQRGQIYTKEEFLHALQK